MEDFIHVKANCYDILSKIQSTKGGRMMNKKPDFASMAFRDRSEDPPLERPPGRRRSKKRPAKAWKNPSLIPWSRSMSLPSTPPKT